VHRPRNYQPAGDPLALLGRGLTRLNTVWLRTVYPFASIGRNVTIHFTSRIHRERAFRISIGNSVILWNGTWLNVANDSLDRDIPPAILIEDNCSIGADSIISARNQVHLESGVLLAQAILIMDHSHAYEDITTPIIEQGVTEGGRIRIGEGSWIGHGAAIVCPRGELVIGRHCVIAANAVVTRSIPDYSVVGGIPARVIRQYDPETHAWRSASPEVTPSSRERS
jgi:acetyltransferase-like isoleucine patch superfamily enzyme